MSTLRKLRRTSHMGENRQKPIPWEPLSFTRKMSEVLLDFAEPLLEAFDDDTRFKEAIGLAALCWNLTLLPPNERQAELNDIADKLAGGGAFKRHGVLESIHMLMDRKRVLFADDSRLVINYEIVEEKAGPRLLVMSDPFEDDRAPNQ